MKGCYDGLFSHLHPILGYRVSLSPVSRNEGITMQPEWIGASDLRPFDVIELKLDGTPLMLTVESVSITPKRGLVNVRFADGQGTDRYHSAKAMRLIDRPVSEWHCNDPRHATPCSGPMCSACREDCSPKYWNKL